MSKVNSREQLLRRKIHSKLRQSQYSLASASTCLKAWHTWWTIQDRFLSPLLTAIFAVSSTWMSYHVMRMALKTWKMTSSQMTRRISWTAHLTLRCKFHRLPIWSKTTAMSSANTSSIWTKPSIPPFNVKARVRHHNSITLINIM